MATGEDEPQPIVLDRFAVPWSGLVDDGLHLLGNILHRVEPRASAYAIDGLEATGRYEPRARIRGDAVARPLLERRSESVVQRLLGEVEVAEQPDQRGEYAARFGTIDGVGHLTHVLGRFRAHWQLVAVTFHRQWTGLNGYLKAPERMKAPALFRPKWRTARASVSH